MFEDSLDLLLLNCWKMRIISYLVIGVCANMKESLANIPKYELKLMDGILYKQGKSSADAHYMLNCTYIRDFSTLEMLLGNNSIIRFYIFH